METFPEMTTTVTGLDRLSGITDPGGVAGDHERHPDPGGARAGTLTDVHRAAQQEILASYDAAPDGEKGAILHREGLYSSLIRRPRTIEADMTDRSVSAWAAGPTAA
jgi:transposase